MPSKSFAEQINAIEELEASKNGTNDDVIDQAIETLELETAAELAAKEEEEETNIGCDFLDILTPVAMAFEPLDAYSKSRVLQSIGRDIIGAIGWNRAFMEKILYGSSAQAQALQDSDRAEDGTFIGYYAETEIGANGQPITSVYDTLSENQRTLLEDLEDKEDALWDAFSATRNAFADMQGEGNVPFIKPSQKQRLEGVRSLDDMVENQKVFALNWSAQKEAEAANKAASRDKQIRHYTQTERNARRRVFQEALPI